METWEYDTMAVLALTTNEEEWKQLLNQRGAEGWELAGVAESHLVNPSPTGAGVMATTPQLVFILKRRTG